MTKIAVTAGAGDRCDRVFAWPANHWNWTETLPYKHGNRFGQLIHIGGQVALDSNAKVLKPDDIVEQTRIALRNIKAVLAELDADINDVVKVTTFYQGKASAEALHENLVIRSDAFKSPGPATSGIPMPHLVYQSMLIEIEVIAILDK
jgi:enamine deaminase RidA (YjgF/YER057c/UK114 family)